MVGEVKKNKSWKQEDLMGNEAPWELWHSERSGMSALWTRRTCVDDSPIVVDDLIISLYSD